MSSRPDFDLMTFLLSFEGRASRSDYWLRFVLPYVGLSVLAALIDASFATATFSAILVLAGIWPSLAIAARRCHDRDRSAWFILVGFVPIVNIWYLVEIGFLPGTVGRNRFGADPLL